MSVVFVRWGNQWGAIYNTLGRHTPIASLLSRLPVFQRLLLVRLYLEQLIDLFPQ